MEPSTASQRQAQERASWGRLSEQHLYFIWQDQEDSNLQSPNLESGALPIRLWSHPI